MNYLGWFLCLSLAFMVSCLGMIYGWGVPPQSWAAIIMAWVATLFLVGVANLFLKKR